MARRGSRSPAPATILAALASALAGCAAPGDGPDGAEALCFLETRPANGVLAAEAIMPLVERTATYRVIAGKGASDGATVMLRVAPDEREAAEWARTEGDRRVELLARDGNDQVVLVAVIDHESSAVTRFRPPLVAAWSELAAGEPRASRSAMRVFDLRTNRVREAGEATRTVRWVEDQQVRLAGRTHWAHRIEVEFVADLRLADAYDRTMLFISEEGELLAEVRREEVRVLGVLPTVTERTMVREES